MPNFFVLGVMKAGTTALFRYLRQHPDIYMSLRKEPHFFSPEDTHGGPDPSHDPQMSLEEYQALFSGARTEKMRGEATPVYVYDAAALERISREVPGAKVIVSLRQPVDRAYSAWLMKTRQGWERLSFADALAAEPARVEDNWSPGWHYAGLGRYRRQLDEVARRFDPERVKVVLFDDLVRDPLALLRGLFGFLGVDDAFHPDLAIERNVAFVVRSPRLHRWVTERSSLRRRLKQLVPGLLRPAWERLKVANDTVNRLPPPPLSPELRTRLTREWMDEIDAVESFLGRDLSPWRVPRDG